MLKRIFLPWLVVRELEQQLVMRRAEEQYLRKAIDTLMRERGRWLIGWAYHTSRYTHGPKRDERGRFVKAD